MITKILVKDLFGTFTHPIELKEGNITLLLGENGLGKTVILKMIKAFFDSNFAELQSYMFTVFEINFADNSTVTITKTESKDKDSLTFELKVNDKPQKPSFKKSFDNNHRERSRDLYTSRDLINVLRHYLPVPIERVGPSRWLDHSKGEVFRTDQIIELYRNYLPEEFRKHDDGSIPSWLTQKTKLLNIKFIETQRLLTKIASEETSYHSTVDRYSRNLVETIKNRTVIATDLAAKLDRSYPNRVVEKITQTNEITDTALEDGLANLNLRRELLKKVGLIDTNEEMMPVTAAWKNQTSNKTLLKTVLQIYVEDSNEKLALYENLAQKINLLIEIINKRFLFKKLSINRKEGFVFISTKTGKSIPLAGLSSGEQHELVLFFQLLFDTEENSLLLIDEPEISLHISWQNQFINDLTDVNQLNSFAAIIATHSPDIINNRWDLTVQLKGE